MAWISKMVSFIVTKREYNRPTCDCLQDCESKLGTTDFSLPKMVSFARWHWYSTALELTPLCRYNWNNDRENNRHQPLPLKWNGTTPKYKLVCLCQSRNHCFYNVYKLDWINMYSFIKRSHDSAIGPNIGPVETSQFPESTGRRSNVPNYLTVNKKGYSGR